MAEPAVSSAVAQISRMAKPSTCIEKNHEWELEVACEAAKEVLRRRADELVRQADRGPVLSSRSCDGTPIVVTSRTKQKLDSGESVSSSGFAGREFLVSNQFFRVEETGGSFATAVTISEPVALAHGKSANAILEASRKDWRSLRQMGHFGPAVEHYCWDRAGLTTLERLSRQWHKNQDHGGRPRDLSEQASRLLEFVVITPCSLHDAQNGFRWGMYEQCSNRELLRDCYVGIESLRNSADLISSQMARWITEKMRLRPDKGDAWKDEQQALFEALDVPFDIVDSLVHKLQLCYDGTTGILEIFEGAQEELDQDVVSEISAVLASVWRFTRFSESRWLTVGTSARTLIAGMLTGLADLVAMIRKDKSLSHFYINGFGRLTKDRMGFLITAAMSSRVAESLQAELMQDNRVALRYDELWRAMTQELRWLIDVDEQVWIKLSGLCDLRPGMLRHDCIAAAHRGYHFFYRRVLRPASMHPWSLCRGDDLLQNLRDLHSGPYPEEPVAQQLWELMDMHWNEGELVATLRLLGQCGWTSLVAEQQHASLAQLKKQHPMYGVETLVNRALMLQVSRLLPSESRLQKQIQKVTRQRDKLDDKNPNKVNGRAMFLKAYLKVVRGRVQEEGGDVQQKWERRSKSLWKAHGILYARQSLQVQQECSLRARHYREQRHRELDEEFQSLLAQLEVLQVREGDEAAAEDSPPIMMSAAGFTDEDLARYTSLVEDPEFASRKNLSLRRSLAVSCPPPLGKAELEQLSRHQVWTYKDPEQPSWVDRISRDREGFVDAVLIVDDPEEEEEEYFKVLYAVKAPNRYLALCRLDQKSTTGDWHCEGDDIWKVAEHSRHCTFRCNFARVVTAADIGDVPLEYLKVMMVTRHDGGTKLTCISEPVDLDFLTGRDAGPLGDDDDMDEDEDEVAPKKKQKSSKDKDYESLLHDLPWLVYLDQQLGFDTRKKEKPLPEDPVQRAVAEANADPVPEDVLIATMSEMEKARSALAADLAPAPGADFGTTLRGGVRAKTKKGKAPDAVQAVALNQASVDWCLARKLQQTLKGTFSEHDGQENCLVLVRCWSHKMQFFYDLENASEDGPAHVFTVTEINSYVEPAELKDLLDRTTKLKTLQWIAKIRGIPHPNKA